MSYSMQLKDILALLSMKSDSSETISCLALDSRKVVSGALFFAYPGSDADGRNYIEAAQSAGAAAVVYDSIDFQLPEAITIPAFAVQQLRGMVGFVANEFYAKPTSEMQVFGVTGTNGKTTCCYLLTQALQKLGMRAAMIGTIGVGALDALSTSGHTTPDPIAIHKLLAEFRDQGFTQVCMEVSSHALDQGRVNGVQFFCSMFTNLSHDHLDYHGDMQSYADAKRRLFTEFHSELVISNANDSLGAGLIDIADAEFIVSYGAGGDVYAEDIKLGTNGIELFIEGNGVEFALNTPLVGSVNIPNIELLVATLLALSTSIDDIQSIISQLSPAPGRMELFSATGKPQVIVDYAHTPDALEKALLSVKEHCRGDLWCVFGCGGDRDSAKRPIMGAAAEKYADQLVITNDNPRSEAGDVIAEQIAAGIDSQPQIILDRAKAIGLAIAEAENDDWVLVAGKGHETTQQIGEQYLPFSDRECVSAALGGSL